MDLVYDISGRGGTIMVLINIFVGISPALSCFYEKSDTYVFYSSDTINNKVISKFGVYMKEEMLFSCLSI